MSFHRQGEVLYHGMVKAVASFKPALHTHALSLILREQRSLSFFSSRPVKVSWWHTVIHCTVKSCAYPAYKDHDGNCAQLVSFCSYICTDAFLLWLLFALVYSHLLVQAGEASWRLSFEKAERWSHSHWSIGNCASENELRVDCVPIFCE